LAFLHESGVTSLAQTFEKRRIPTPKEKKKKMREKGGKEERKKTWRGDAAARYGENNNNKRAVWSRTESATQSRAPVILKSTCKYQKNTLPSTLLR
jgi:DMSO/TMAO reductase YedYZ molybdopterin-dependent catalytic subunit